MGCDIHIVLERRRVGQPEWIGVYCTDDLPGGRPKIAQRDYDFFAEVASVRGHTTTGHYPRNLPEDVSRLAWTAYMEAPTDHHSVSHMSAQEFASVHSKVNPDASRPEYAAYDLLGVENYDEKYEHRVVFWFDN